jgi:hypothetical protein
MDSLLPLALLLVVLLVLIVLLRWVRRQREQEPAFTASPVRETHTEVPPEPAWSVALEEPEAEPEAEAREPVERSVSQMAPEPEPPAPELDQTEEAVKMPAPVPVASPSRADALLPELDLFPPRQAPDRHAPQRPATEPAKVAEIPEEVHQKARRLARVLIQEIKMYHAAKVEQARSAGTLLTQLSKEIDQGKAVYNSRTPREILESKSYFEDALLEILAEGDASLLK